MLKHIITRLKLVVARIHMKNHCGVSPILATVMIFALIITGVMITFIQVVPYIEQAKSEEAIATVQNSFISLDDVIKPLLSESTTPGGFRTVFISKPAGRIDYVPDQFYYSFRLLDQNQYEVYNILEQITPDGIQEIGVLDWVYRSPRSVLARGTSKYLTGPDPYKIREPVFIKGTFASEDYQDITNLTLSHLNDRRHHIILNYRIPIYITISTNPEPEIRFDICLILLKADFESIHSQFEQISINSRCNSYNPYTLPSNDSIGKLELVWDYHHPSGINTTSLWDTQSIRGLDVKHFNIVVQICTYEIGLSIS